MKSYAPKINEVKTQNINVLNNDLHRPFYPTVKKYLVKPEGRGPPIMASTMQIAKSEYLEETFSLGRILNKRSSQPSEM